MGYQALLFCADEITVRLVTQVLNELEFSVEPANEPFTAVKRLTTQHFDAVVADCDNEQNAALLFKSARNSGPNKTSLAVAVVEGQPGIAKAFRIGANLVLTKPINVEQSKGTLRVARGLLKKGEAAAKIAPAPVASHATPQPERPTPSNPAFSRPLTPMAPSARPIVPPKSITTPPAPLVRAEAASTLELEEEPIAQPEPTDVALLESLPEPETPAPQPSSLHKTAPWAPVKSSSGAATGVAPARKITQMPHSETTPTKIPAAFMPPAIEEATKPRVTARPAESHAPVQPITHAKTTESGGSKKGLIIAAGVLIAAAGGYFGWTKFQATTMKSVESNPVQTAPAQGSTQSATVPSASVQASVPSTTVVAPQQTPVASAPPRTREERGIPEPEVITRKLTPESKITPVATEHAHEAIVVKGSAAKPAALEIPPQAIPVIGIASNSGDKVIAGIMQTSAPAPVLRTMRVSQGVSQGLVIKKVSPEYPVQARQLRIEGAVQLEATISKEGKVSNVKVLGGHPILARAAAEAVKQWKYKPYLLNDQPVEIDTQITVNFKLP
jgi:protein TonB